MLKVENFLIVFNWHRRSSKIHFVSDKENDDYLKIVWLALANAFHGYLSGVGGTDKCDLLSSYLQTFPKNQVENLSFPHD